MAWELLLSARRQLLNFRRVIRSKFKAQLAQIENFNQIKK